MVSGCAHHDEFHLRNAKTGQTVTCRSGGYRFEEGEAQFRIADQCMRACARYGFWPYGAHPYGGVTPRTPDDDVRPFIPKECLP
ncbi:hypothetical protein FBZ89_1468 [Nitrospirillum amazonense]|uniref:Uncharacterized protein n=1 Tax=Nitrospirillum amazonense TaxID=28077 RepID=A0A560EIG8_9PROT|nr:hypothetical protein FBZ89_1468 [Nitrospirillum amazonense]